MPSLNNGGILAVGKTVKRKFYPCAKGLDEEVAWVWRSLSK